MRNAPDEAVEEGQQRQEHQEQVQAVTMEEEACQTEEDEVLSQLVPKGMLERFEETSRARKTLRPFGGAN